MSEVDPERLAVAVGGAVASAIAAANPRIDVPAPLKWAAGILSAIAVASVTGMGVWMVSTIADVQLTVTRMDERAAAQATMQERQNTETLRRVQRLEDIQEGRAL